MSRTDERLRPRERVRRKADFDRAYAEGRRFSGRYFIAYLLFRERGPLRVGVVASRKLGGAVRRNRAKRLLRDLFRNHKPAGAVHADLVLIARSALLEATYEQVERAYIQALGRSLEESPRLGG